MTTTTTEKLRERVADVNVRLTHLDGKIGAAEDAGTFAKIPPLREERAAIAQTLPTLQSELAAAEATERNADRAKKLPQLVETYQDAGVKLRAALDPFVAATEDLSKARFFQDATAQWAAGALQHEYSDMPEVQLGPNPAVRSGGTSVRVQSHSKELVTEVCRIIEPLVRECGDKYLADQLRLRIRAGNRLPNV